MKHWILPGVAMAAAHACDTLATRFARDYPRGRRSSGHLGRSRRRTTEDV